LKRLIKPIACSLVALLLEISLFRRLSSLVKGTFFERFFGNIELAWIFAMPWYPVSVSA
jgi:hypothetical protein